MGRWRTSERRTEAVLGLLVVDAERHRPSSEIRNATGFGLGSIYPILSQLEALHWVESDWQPTTPEQGLPRRRYYRLSRDGLALARGALASARPRPAGGYAASRLRQARTAG